jgi:hypothetical protein
MALILWHAAASVALLVALCTAVCYFSFFVWEARGRRTASGARCVAK